MKAVFARPSLFFAVPLLVSVLGAALTFDLPAAYLPGFGMLVLLALLAVCIDILMRVRMPARQEIARALSGDSRERTLALGLAWLVIAAGIVDLVAFPLPLRNPEIYADFSGGRSYVRHISNMCWILPVVGIMCVGRTSLRAFFVLFGLVFPVLVLDRNRLFASTYAFIAVMILRAPRDLPWKKIALTGAVLLVLFGQLGKVRSGDLEWVALPFSGLYEALPPGFKWLLLYIGSGAYNFAAIEAKHYRDDDFLVNQLVPGAGSVETVGTGIPFDEPVINVGTEYLPFLMAFGPVGAALAAVVLYLALVASVRFLRERTSLFTFLIFLRLSYVCLMSGFAPQAYIWTNFGFVGLCVLLLVLSSMLPRRSALRDVPSP